MELLTTAAVVSLLMAVLLPVVQAASRQARAVVCRAQLRQWGVGLSTFVEDSEGAIICSPADAWDQFWSLYCDGQKGLSLCPMAKRYETNKEDRHWAVRESSGKGLGSTFTAWKWPYRTLASAESLPLLGSYGMNEGGLLYPDMQIRSDRKVLPSDVPILLDCVSWTAGAHSGDEPPSYEGDLSGRGIQRCVIDRHGGGINSVFLDWSVRKVGLKELWTLEWSPFFDPRGPWTRAGGVQPGDWPEWMRGFRDY